MPGWGKLVAGAVLGAAGTLYATNEEFRKALPRRARELPASVRRRFEEARTAAREASETRRAEILRELETHSAEAHDAGARQLETDRAGRELWEPPLDLEDGSTAARPIAGPRAPEDV